MGYKNIIISTDCDLSTKDEQLILNIRGNDEYTMPIEDVSTMVLEGQGIKITNRLISKLSDNKVMFFTCNEKHMPTGVFMPFNTHTRIAKIQKKQIEVSEPFKKRVWKNIIETKIKNQAEVLKIINKNCSELVLLSNNITSGDKDNKEATAARMYFKNLFDKFTRSDECWINSALNYGYSILRGAIARSIVVYGLIPSIGVHHCSELNNFNLADDFIEPLRPLVDLWVRRNMKQEEFTSSDKANLVDLLNYEMIINNEKHSVLNIIDIMISSYSSAILNSDYSKLKLPRLMDLKYHYYE